ncbi:MAG: bifunctional phosphoribosyl-AMP cyclohydrolase/phosphoribosyl-ATP diphosphatase HisIE [Proteobacteria bacterium]|nr:bifunctional phosphoribosyl-AMP cyclohydrolase/phosphoribosyl-ATP diphosphatase HisIE [Pseudomonadota bacterium]
MKDIDFSKFKFDSAGLIPAIVQDAENGQVLMMAWMNAEALRMTVRTGLTHFYSRSRKKLWQKGETSGHIQKVREILYDCDADCLLVKAEQVVAACHTGHRSCFFTSLEGEATATPVFDAGKVYGGASSGIVEKLFDVILQRKKEPSDGSYTSFLFSSGGKAMGDKVLEEAGEFVEASAQKNPEKLIGEAADLLYHALVLLAASGVTPAHVREELQARFGVGGFEEKKSRKKQDRFPFPNNGSARAGLTQENGSGEEDPNA